MEIAIIEEGVQLVKECVHCFSMVQRGAILVLELCTVRLSALLVSLISAGRSKIWVMLMLNRRRDRTPP